MKILLERLTFGSLEWDAEATTRAIHRTTALIEAQREALGQAENALRSVLESAGYVSGENSSGHKQMMVSVRALDMARAAHTELRDVLGWMRPVPWWDDSPEARALADTLSCAYWAKHSGDAGARTVSFAEWLRLADEALAEAEGR